MTPIDSTAPRIAAAFDPLDPSFLADPHPTFARARREAPIFYSPRTRRWIVMAYDDVAAVLTDCRRFSSRGTIAMPPEQLPAVRASLGGRPYPFEVPSLVNNDPASHTRFRGLVRRALTPQHVAALEPKVRKLAADLIDNGAAGGRIELVSQFTRPLSLMTLAAVMDVSDDNMERLRGWIELGVQAAQPDLTAAQRAVCVRGVAEWQAFCLELIRARRGRPGGDFVSRLLRTSLDGRASLNDDEAAAVLIQLQIAGFVTTADFIASAVRVLLGTPGRWAALTSDASSMARVIEEVLRLESPLTLATRTTTTELELGGCVLPEGARLRLMLGSANRDESRFSEPHRFNQGRGGSPRHLAFGLGAHFCVGAALARLESRIALQELARRLPGLRLASNDEAQYRRSVVFRGLERLELEWCARGVALTAARAADREASATEPRQPITEV